MHLLYEMLPVLLFFLAYKFFGVYTATKVGMIAFSLHVLATRLYTGKWNRTQIFAMIVFDLLGSMTLYFHNPIFVKWKPTIVFWIFALVVLITPFFTRKPIMQLMMEPALEDKHNVPSRVWRNINLLWATFFIAMGALNIYIAYTFSESIWFNFHFYGTYVAMAVFIFIQVIYLMFNITDKQPTT